MEAVAAVDIYERSKKDGVHYSTFIDDEDSTTISHMRQVAGAQTSVVMNKILPRKKKKQTNKQNKNDPLPER